MAVSVDAVEDSQGLARRLGLGFPIVADTDRSLTKGFGLYDADNDIAWPAVFVLDREGAVSWRSFEETYKERVPIEEIIHATAEASR